MKIPETDSKFGDNYKLRSLCTGVVVACVGSVDALGEMLVEAIYVSSVSDNEVGERVQEEGKMEKAKVDGEESEFAPVVMLMSGLKVGQEGGDMLPLQLLVDYISGSLSGGDKESLLGKGSGANVARIIVAGGATGSNAFTKGDLDEMDVKKVRRDEEFVYIRCDFY